MKTRAVVVSVGARTSVGLDATTTAFLYRATAAGMRLSPLLDLDEEPATMCFLPTLPPTMVGADRAIALARPALEEALAALELVAPELRAKLVLCLDEIPPEARGAAQQIVTDLTRAAARRLPKLDVATSARGGAAMAFALDGALAELERHTLDAIVVVGAHSDYDPARIQGLSAARRLFTVDRLDALIPGECAAAAVIMRGDHARSLRLPSRARIHTLATGHTRARPDNDESAYEAAAITAVARAAGAELEQHGLRAGWFLTDLSFERWRLYELQSMMTRTQKLWCEPQYCDAPAQRLGYLGAAAMPLHVVLAAEAWRRGFAPHPIAMSLAGSDGGERAAMLLSSP